MNSDVSGGRQTALRISAAIGAVIGYGCLLAFSCLIILQVYRWFRDGEWMHFGVNEGMRLSLAHCCVKEGDSGRFAALEHWLETPVDWLGLHKVLEIMPASLALFLLSILGNCLFIYCREQQTRQLRHPVAEE